MSIFKHKGMCVKSPMLDKIKPAHKFISRGNPHITTHRFCNSLVRPNSNSKKHSEKENEKVFNFCNQDLL